MAEARGSFAWSAAKLGSVISWAIPFSVVIQRFVTEGLHQRRLSNLIQRIYVCAQFNNVAQSFVVSVTRREMSRNEAGVWVFLVEHLFHFILVQNKRFVRATESQNMELRRRRVEAILLPRQKSRRHRDELPRHSGMKSKSSILNCQFWDFRKVNKYIQKEKIKGLLQKRLNEVSLYWNHGRDLRRLHGWSLWKETSWSFMTSEVFSPFDSFLRKADPRVTGIFHIWTFRVSICILRYKCSFQFGLCEVAVGW